MDFTNRINRITFILERLSKGYGLSTPNLEEYFSISKKIIQTDFKNVILPMFDEIIYYDYTSKTYVSDKNFLTATLFSSEELALIAILKSKAKDKYSDENLSEKVDTLFSNYEELLSNDIYNIASVESLDKFKKEVVLIKNAIATKHIISLKYNDIQRSVYPLKIINIDAFWYLVLYEEKDKKIKTFHINSIENINILTKRFRYENDYIKKFENCINAYFVADSEPTSVILFIDSQVAKYFKAKPLNSSQRVMETYSDGSIDIELSISTFREIIPTIQKYIPHVKVVEPKELENLVYENLRNYFKSNPFDN